MEITNDVRVTVRVNKELKEQADVLFEHLGLNMSTALNIFLRKAVDEKMIPFQIGIKNSDDVPFPQTKDMTDIFKKNVLGAIELHKANGAPLAMYDKDRKRAYLQYPDGRVEYAGE